MLSNVGRSWGLHFGSIVSFYPYIIGEYISIVDIIDINYSDGKISPSRFKSTIYFTDDVKDSNSPIISEVFSWIFRRCDDTIRTN